MGEYYLAIDIGASSGRHILGRIENGILKLEEIYRFQNGLVNKDGEACWDTKQLFCDIKEGMKKCREAGKVPASMGIDTWGVDFVLLDADDKVLGNSVSYRDKRTEGMDEKVYELIPEAKLYERTGIQKQLFNTIYQLMAIKQKKPQILSAAECMLMIPDYFNFLLTGKKAAEYTEASTSQLLNPKTLDWDMDLIKLLGFPEKLFQKINQPGTVLGRLTCEIQEEVGFDCDVILPASHDTGSAVMAVPVAEQERDGDFIYISSGTWSLMGTELAHADCSAQSRRLNLTNEGGYGNTVRYLKNIMGLWMIQSLKKELDNKYSFAQLCEMAEGADIASIVDCQDSRFLAPDSMMDAVRGFCAETGQKEPEAPAEYARVIYRSLAQCYGKTICEIEEMTKVNYPCIHVIGGGANAAYLNRLTALACKKRVYAGPTEATAIGNLLAQLIASGELKDICEARSCVYNSFEIECFDA